MASDLSQNVFVQKKTLSKVEWIKSEEALAVIAPGWKFAETCMKQCPRLKLMIITKDPVEERIRQMDVTVFRLGDKLVKAKASAQGVPSVRTRPQAEVITIIAEIRKSELVLLTEEYKKCYELSGISTNKEQDRTRMIQQLCPEDFQEKVRLTNVRQSLVEMPIDFRDNLGEHRPDISPTASCTWPKSQSLEDVREVYEQILPTESVQLYGIAVKQSKFEPFCIRSAPETLAMVRGAILSATPGWIQFDKGTLIMDAKLHYALDGLEDGFALLEVSQLLKTKLKDKDDKPWSHVPMDGPFWSLGRKFSKMPPKCHPLAYSSMMTWLNQWSWKSKNGKENPSGQSQLKCNDPNGGAHQRTKGTKK